MIPIGEVFGDLDGPVKELRGASPQALHHFTRADQVNQLVNASEADPDRGFMARMMALCSLPRTNPGNRFRYVRRNGPYKLIMSATGDHKLPFGNLPRLILAWLSTEAVRTQNREIVLGRSLAEFMRELGIYSSGGVVQIRLRNQMRRLFGCTVQLTYKDANVERFVNSPIAESGEYWWNPQRPDQPSLWDSKIELNDIISHPVPIDMNTLAALKRCSLGLDLYLWRVYRTFALRAPQRLTWKQLYCQFGPTPNSAATHDAVQNFRRRILREMKKIKLAWKELNYSTAPGVLILHPSTPAIAPLNQGQLTS